MTQRFSLSSQISEVEREIEQRGKTYAHLVAVRKMRHEEAVLKTNIMRSVLATLNWLRENEAKIKAKVDAGEPNTQILSWMEANNYATYFGSDVAGALQHLVHQARTEGAASAHAKLESDNEAREAAAS